MADKSAANVLIVGCGDLGGAVAVRLLQSGISVLGVRRGASCTDTRNIAMIAADVTQPETLSVLDAVQPEILVYCVSAGGQTDAQYKAAYVDGLRHTLAAQSSNPRLKHIFFISSTRVYGQETDALLDESVVPVPADFGGTRLLEAEGLLREQLCRSTILRLSGIYGPGRVRMLNLAKSPENWPRSNTWTNRIHRDDAAAFIVFLIQHVLAGKMVESCYIVTDSRPAPQFEVLGWLAAQMQTANAEPLPVNGGKRLSNQALLASGFKLQYQDYRAGYSSLLLQASV